MIEVVGCRPDWPEYALTLMVSVMVLGFAGTFWQGGNWPPALLVWRLGLSAVLVGLAVWDWRAGLIPNRGTWPLIGIGLASLTAHLLQRTVSLDALRLVGVGWTVCLLSWWTGILRGGDAKLIMGSLALFPDHRFLWILLGVLFTGSLTAVVLKQGGRGLRRLGGLFYTVVVGRTLPTRDEIEASYLEPGRSHRMGYLFSLAGLIFLWLF